MVRLKQIEKNSTIEDEKDEENSVEHRQHDWLRHSYQLQENNWIPVCQLDDEKYHDIQYKFFAHGIFISECKQYERFSYLLRRCVPLISRRFSVGK